MTFAALWVSVGIGACAFAEGPAKPPMVPIVGTVADAGRRPAGGAEASFSHFKNDGVAGGGEVVARTSTALARALAAVAPERAVALVESMPDEAGAGPRVALSPEDHARLELADFLGRPPAERWDRIARLILELWVVDH